MLYHLTDNKGNQHRVNADIYYKLKDTPLSSLKGGYAVFYKGTGRRNGLLLHRYVAGATTGEVVDHKDRNLFNSTRRNLRKTSQAGNIANSRPSRRNKFGLKGVSRKRNKFAAFFENKNLGSYATPEIAARVYDQAVFHKWGRKGYLNYPKRNDKEISDFCAGADYRTAPS